MYASVSVCVCDPFESLSGFVLWLVTELMISDICLIAKVTGECFDTRVCVYAYGYVTKVVLYSLCMHTLYSILMIIVPLIVPSYCYTFIWTACEIQCMC